MITHHPLTPIKTSDSEGQRWWWLGTLATIKLSAEETGGALTILEVLLPHGYEVPPHVHHLEHETFRVLEGEVTFTVGSETLPGRAGDILFGPRGVPHHFRVDRGPARVEYLLTPGGFEGFVRESGEAAQSDRLPPPNIGPDFDRLPEIAARYGNELLTP